MQVRSLGWEDPPEEGMATHSSILAWRIPWTEEPGRPWGLTESDKPEATLHAHKKECTIDTCSNLDESPKNYTEWHKPILKGYTLFDSIYTKFLK